MIGDRKHDVIGALANHISCLGVLYDYGSKQELVDAGAIGTVQRPEDWLPFILG